ncbi:pyruvate ferredoxin oxidoreductase [Candidatus Bathyarchaeota archaeon]|nr:pyruvate ferredoxin oxidoreductase [Candidatus Bathyarchaeota archaeon]
MQKIVGLTGDEAVAYAAKQSSVDVVAAYPITPQTVIVEQFAQYVANGEVHTEFVCVESEHSALSACIGASLTGARVFTATASQGLALMHEMLYIASSLRCPIVMAVANRALSAPINIYADHSDMMGSRDSGWIQVYAEDAQEAYDWTLQAFDIAEKDNVMLPVSVNLDGFTISHSMEGISVLEDDAARKFLPPRPISYIVDPDRPITIGAGNNPEYYFEFKRQQEDALRRSSKAVLETARKFGAISGRKYGVLDTYGLEDADVAMVGLGSCMGTVIEAARRLRKKGAKVGAIKLWLYRPFPERELLRTLEGLKSLVVLDRSCSFGAPNGALCSDILSTLYSTNLKLKISNVIYGLGGRDMTVPMIEAIYRRALRQKKQPLKRDVRFVGVRE